MKYYAGIGSRQTPLEVITVMEGVGRALAEQGYTCRTGAALGADQAFANGAIGYGPVDLSLPWFSYEEAWVKQLQIKGQVIINVLPNGHNDAFASVEQFHPAPDKLKPAVKKLHARNWMIMQHAEFIVCWTPGGAISGGTGQALRIAAAATNIPVYNLGNQDVLTSFIIQLQKRSIL